MNDKVIQIGGKSYKQMEVIMLPTKKATTGMIVKSPNNTLEIITNRNFDEKCQEVLDKSIKIPQHLYILSSEEIKEDDWCYNPHNNEIFQAYKKKDFIFVDCKKIIATTDSEVKIHVGTCFSMEELFKPLPRTSNDFIKAYVKAQGKGFDKVLVEYEELGEYGRILLKKSPYNNASNSDMSIYKFYLKIVPDNTVTIKPIQEEKTSWNRDELIIVLNKFGNNIYGEYIRNKTMLDFVHKWISENL